MRIKTQKKFKRGMAIALVGMFFTSACATTSYVPKQSGMIKVMPNGYQRDDQFYNRGIFNSGLIKAVQPNEEAVHYAKRSSKNSKWFLGLLEGGVIAWAAGIATLDANRPNGSTRNVVANSLIYTGLASAILSLFPAHRARASQSDAINKYNDDILQKTAPQIFNTPVPATKPEKKKSEVESKKSPETSVVTVQQKEESGNE